MKKPCECEAKNGAVSCAAHIGILEDGYYCRFNPQLVFVVAEIERDENGQIKSWTLPGTGYS
jgi:hypothetical protein